MKRLLAVLLMLVILVFTFTSCDVIDSIKDAILNPDSEEGAHEHTYADGWTKDDNSHWHAATCEHAGEKKDLAAHTFTDGVCICGLTDPDYTEQPGNPDEPGDPENPDNPDEPGDPENPGDNDEPTQDELVIGKDYNVYVNVESLGGALYFTGGTGSSAWYLATSTGISDAAVLRVEAVSGVNGGYYLYFMNGGVKTYVEAYERTAGEAGKGKGSIQLVTTTPSAYYTYDDTYKTLVVTSDDGLNKYYIGTYYSAKEDRIFDTLSCSNYSYLAADNVGVTQFPMYFVAAGTAVTPDTPADPDTPSGGTDNPSGSQGALATGKDYNVYVDVDSLGGTLYFTGGTGSSAWYLATSSDRSDAAVLRVETVNGVNGGYYLYFMNGGVKTYVEAYERTAGEAGKGKGSIQLITTTPTTYYTYDDTYNTLVITSSDGLNKYYIGTYYSPTESRVFGTLSCSNYSYLAADNVGVTQFPMYFAEVGADVTPDNPGSDTPSGGTDNPSEPSNPGTGSVTVSKTVTELADTIDAALNGSVMSGEVFKLDNNITVEFFKGSANNDPAYYTTSGDADAVRIYQNGGYMTITAKNGSVINTIKITTSGSMTGGSGLSVSGGRAQLNDNVITITANSGVTSVTVTAAGSNKSERLYVAAIEVTYGGGSSSGGSSSGGTTPPSGGDQSGYAHTDFTASEKAEYNSYVGFVIPFLPTDDYSIEAYNEDGYKGVYYSAISASKSEFDSYLAQFSKYQNDGTETDTDGDTWYLFSNGDVFIDLCRYEYQGIYYVDVDVYCDESLSVGGGSSDDTDPPSGGGNTSGGTTDSGYPSGSGVITNDAAGLPADDGDGVIDLDFTGATNVKDVTDQGYYLDGCPTVGSPAVLVIPVEFSDVTASSRGYSIAKIKEAFREGGNTDYYSVYDYYYISSYGQLTLDITVLDSWFKPQYSSTYYKSQTMDYYGDSVEIGDQMIMDEVLAYLEGIMDLSDYDSDGNGIIDSIVLINTLDIDPDETFYWAYRYWNIYTDDDGYYYEYDGVSANDYLWAPYRFLYEDESGNYNDTSAMNTYTFIHEFAHVLGVDDYYDTSYSGDEGPMDGYDIMDSMIGDHNAYTKFNLGWITESRLVVTGSSVTLTLECFSTSGDTIILANDWDEDLGAYQEYYVIVYYTGTGLNGDGYGYFDGTGILVYHVNATLYREELDGEVYYDVYNNNTDSSDSYGTVYNLIEFVQDNDGDYLYGVGDTLDAVSDDSGEALGYVFTVVSLGANSATITFTNTAA